MRKIYHLKWKCRIGIPDAAFTVLIITVLSFTLVISSVSKSFSQEDRVITGRVTSVEGERLPGVSVLVLGTKRGSATDVNGAYTIKVSRGETLRFALLGYEVYNIKIGNQTTVDIKMEEDVTTLDQVVVNVGYGSMRKADLSSANVSVNATEIQRTVNTTFEQALQGRAANVMVSAGSGQPGAAPSVIIRGINSLTGNTQPLYVIDGVQIRGSNPGENPGMNSLSGLNPDDIESMNILQGPSATAMYGAAGASGVVIVTTKRGKAGETKINFNTLFTVQAQPKYVPVMNLREWAQYRNDLAAAGGAATIPEFADPSVLGDGTDWQRALFRETILQKYSLGLQGGNEKTTFYFSSELFDQEGIAKGSGFNRYSLRLNIDNQTRKWLKIGTNFNVNQTEEVINVSNSGIINMALAQNPSVPIQNPDGSWGGPISQQFQNPNPVALAAINDHRNRRREFNGSGYAAITFLPGLVLHNEANGRFDFTNEYRFNPSYKFGGYENKVTTSDRNARNNYWISMNNRIQLDKRFNSHAINAVIGHEAQKSGGEGIEAGRDNFPSNLVQDLPLGDSKTATNSSSSSWGAKESYFSRVNYVYKDKYIAQISYRADGSSDFGENNRWGYFPAASVAWRISQEGFMKRISSINDLKVRFEYGHSGNSGGSGYWATLQAIPTPWGTGFLAENFSNPDLGWETSKTTNVGFDLKMFNNRLEVIVDGYVKNITDLLTVNQYPYYSGGDLDWSPGYIKFPTMNAGSMKNQGLGITVNTQNIKKEDFEWTTSLNFSIDRNKIVSLKDAGGLNVFYNGIQFQSRPGETAGLMTGYIYEGIFQNIAEIESHAKQTESGTIHPVTGTWVGDAKFKDINNDGIINTEDRTVISNPWPKFTFGFNSFLAYKGFELNLFFTGVSGNDIYNFRRSELSRPLSGGVFNNFYKEVANYARPSDMTPGSTDAYLLNPETSVTRLVIGDPNGNGRINSRFVEDGSYIRLKNASLAYNVPKRFIKKLSFLGGLRAAANVQNVFTITKYTGYDPEVGMFWFGGTMLPGVDNGRYPSTRMFSLSLSADF